MLTDQELINELDGLKRFAIKLCKNEADAEDLLQSTVTKALAHRNSFQSGSKQFSWLSRIMFNDFVTSYKRKTRFESQYDPEEQMANLAVEPDQEVLTLMNEVNQAMNQLSTEHREIIMLVSVYGMSYDDVAEQLNIPVGTVRSRLSRAREQLQLRIDQLHQVSMAHHMGGASLRAPERMLH